MSHTLVTRVVAEAAEHHEKVNHWIVGFAILAVLLGSLVALLFFAGGREHS
jgi:O-antigen/teichoic acid export membrane protein